MYYAFGIPDQTGALGKFDPTQLTSGKGKQKKVVSHHMLTSLLQWSVKRIATTKLSVLALEGNARGGVDQCNHLTYIDRLFSLCSWTGSLHFSDLVSTAASRESFATILTKAVSDYNLDGIDIDWGKHTWSHDSRKVSRNSHLHLQNTPIAPMVSLVTPCKPSFFSSSPFDPLY